MSEFSKALPEPISQHLANDYKLDGSGKVAVSTETRLSKDMAACPRGVKVQLCGAGGVLVYSSYDGDSFWIEWAPLPRRAV